MNTFKTIATSLALAATTLFSVAAHDAYAADGPIGIKTCNRDNSCQSPNGPSLDGISEDASQDAAPNGVKVCNRDNSCQSPNGPSLDGISEVASQDATPNSVKVCNRDSSCQSPNGPSLDGIADISMPTRLMICTEEGLCTGNKRLPD